MEAAFRGVGDFNQDIGDWNVSATTNMANMFRDAGVFRQNLANQGVFTLDIDGDGNLDISTDGNLIIRFMGGQSAIDRIRTDEQILNYLQSIAN